MHNGHGGAGWQPAVAPFAFKDAVIVATATGRRAQTLRELRDHLRVVEVDSVYHHFWGRRLQPRFDDVEHHNDFAAWAADGLRDGLLAERLGAIDPADYSDLERLRNKVLDVVDERLHDREWVPASPSDGEFHFLRPRVVVFDTGRRLDHPDGLPEALAEASLGSLFYHIVEARRRNPGGIDDFRAWLQSFGDPYAELVDALAHIDPYFLSLSEVRRRWINTCLDYVGGAIV